MHSKKSLNPWSPGIERNISFLCTIYVPAGLKGFSILFLLMVFKG